MFVSVVERQRALLEDGCHHTVVWQRYCRTEPSFRKLNSPSTKLRMLFPAHLQARELCPQTYSLSLPLEWSQVTHIPASMKSGGAYKPEKSACVGWFEWRCVEFFLKASIAKFAAFEVKCVFWPVDWN